jgi:uncharacterized repeat protein (TIGR03847 family)
MPRTEIELKPVEHITTDAIGVPGKRVFYVQGRQIDQVVTLILEKAQVQALALGVEEFLNEVYERFPNLPAASADYVEETMHIKPPVDPLFRIGELHLGYHIESDLVVLIAREIVTEGQDPNEVSVVRFWCSRSQLRAMSHWGLEVAARGRAVCPFCGEPINPGDKHVCPKKNGKQHS